MLIVGGVMLFKPVKLPWKQLGAVLFLLLILTSIFDSLIIANGIVAYDTLKTLGIYIGRAPIEDFAYTIAGVIIVPYLWKRYADKD